MEGVCSWLAVRFCVPTSKGTSRVRAAGFRPTASGHPSELSTPKGASRNAFRLQDGTNYSTTTTTNTTPFQPQTSPAPPTNRTAHLHIFLELSRIRRVNRHRDEPGPQARHERHREVQRRRIHQEHAVPRRQRPPPLGPPEQVQAKHPRPVVKLAVGDLVGCLLPAVVEVRP